VEKLEPGGVARLQGRSHDDGAVQAGGGGMSREEVLIAHHIEPMWESAMQETEEYLERVTAHLWAAQYRRVLWLTLEGDGPEHAAREGQYGYRYAEMAEALRYQHDVEVLDWAYGWEPEPEANARHFNLPAEDFITFQGGHGIAFVYDYLKALRGARVVCIGGCRDRCLWDLRMTLWHLGVRHRTIERLIY
jgi:hypothetical protein